VLGIGETHAYRLAGRDEFPVPVVRAGRGYVVPVAGLLHALGLGADGTQSVSWRARYRSATGRERSRHFTRKVDAEKWEREQKALVDAYRAPGRHRQSRADGSVELPSEPFVLLYRHWGVLIDGAAEPLYIGITTNGAGRMRSHAAKGWFEREVASTTYERIPAARAAEIERLAIAVERPRYNIVGREAQAG